MVNNNKARGGVELDSLLQALDGNINVRICQIDVNSLRSAEGVGMDCSMTPATQLLQAAHLIDQGPDASEDGTVPYKANADTKHNTIVRRASKALLKQVEETRKKYAVEVEGLKAEIQLLTKEAQKDRREADLASVTAAAAKKAALSATEELERINAEVQRAKRALQQLNRYHQPSM